MQGDKWIVGSSSGTGKEKKEEFKGFLVGKEITTLGCLQPTLTGAFFLIPDVSRKSGR
jgi:hypothetical protein